MSAWPPAVEAGAGAADAIAGAAAVAAAAVSCCGPAATVVGRGGPPVAAAFPAARDALDERCLVIMDVSDLSAFAGARAGTDGSPCKRKGKHEDEHQPLKIRGALGRCNLPQGGEAPLNLPRGFGRSHSASRRPCRCSPVPPLREQPPPLTVRWRAPPRSPRAPAPLPPPWPVATGVGIPPLRGGLPPLLSSSSSSDDGEFLGVTGGERPCCLRSRYSLLSCSRCSLRRILFSFLRTARSCSRCFAARAVARARGVGGSDRTTSTVTLC
jgi:hypothetical protein